MFRNKLCMVVFLLVCVLLYSGCSNITAENYEKIKMGMDFTETIEICRLPLSAADLCFFHSRIPCVCQRPLPIRCCGRHDYRNYGSVVFYFTIEGTGALTICQVFVLNFDLLLILTIKSIVLIHRQVV